jgi:hypothetical protein
MAFYSQFTFSQIDQRAFILNYNSLIGDKYLLNVIFLVIFGYTLIYFMIAKIYNLLRRNGLHYFSL